MVTDNYYLQGFMQKCAEYGIDFTEELLKEAGMMTMRPKVRAPRVTAPRVTAPSKFQVQAPRVQPPPVPAGGGLKITRPQGGMQVQPLTGPVPRAVPRGSGKGMDAFESAMSAPKGISAKELLSGVGGAAEGAVKKTTQAMGDAGAKTVKQLRDAAAATADATGEVAAKSQGLLSSMWNNPYGRMAILGGGGFTAGQLFGGDDKGRNPGMSAPYAVNPYTAGYYSYGQNEYSPYNYVLR